MKLLDTDHPFFKPLWIRIAVFAFTAAWAAFEVWTGSYFWACLFGAFAALSFHGFFIDFDPSRHKSVKSPDGEG
jgi:hypothetical protein